MAQPPRDLLNLLYEIPFPVRRRSLLRASHHNNVKKILVKWMEYNMLDVWEPEAYKLAKDIPEVADGDLVTPDEWNAALSALNAVDRALAKYIDILPPLDAYPYELFKRYLGRLREAEPGEPISPYQYNSRWSALANLITIMLINMMKRFNTYVVNTGVRKYWDYLILPDGRTVRIPDGKYFKIFSLRPMVFGIEDLTEEIGQWVDWDYDEPKIEVLEITSAKPPHGRLRLSVEAKLTNRLYIDKRLITTLQPGEYTLEVEF